MPPYPARHRCLAKSYGLNLMLCKLIYFGEPFGDFMARPSGGIKMGCCEFCTGCGAIGASGSCCKGRHLVCIIIEPVQRQQYSNGAQAFTAGIYMSRCSRLLCNNFQESSGCMKKGQSSENHPRQKFCGPVKKWGNVVCAAVRVKNELHSGRIFNGASS